MAVKKADLGHLDFLAEGGFGKVYRVASYRLPGDSSPLAFKEFTSQQAEQAKSARAAVKFRAGLSQADRDDLDLYASWPKELVEDAGRDCGLLMPLIPDAFFCSLNDPSGGKTKRARDLGWLITTDVQRKAAGIDLGDVDRIERLMILAQLVYAIGRLHKRGWVFGDVSFKNAVFALNPPRLKLLDCDGAAPLSDTGRSQFSTPYWDPPENPNQGPKKQNLLDEKTDVYKLGLAILRCLTPGKGASTVRAIGRLAGELDGAGTDLVNRALSDNRGLRPAARDIYDYIYQLMMTVNLPDIISARLIKSVILRGQDATVEWDIKDGVEVTIISGNNDRLTVNLTNSPHRYSFQPRAAGPVSIELQSRYSTVSAELGELELFELPPFSVDFDFLPRPQVPPIDAFTLEPVAAVLARRPTVGVGMIPMPPVSGPDAFDFIEAIAPDGARAIQLPRFDDAVAEATNALKDLILNEEIDYAATLRQAKLGV